MLRLDTSELNGLGNWFKDMGLCSSRSAGDRLINAGAVEINGYRAELERFWLLRFDDGLALLFYPSMTWISAPWTIRVGKKWLKVV